MDPLKVMYDCIREIMENDATEENNVLSTGKTLRYQHKHIATLAKESEYQYIYTE